MLTEGKRMTVEEYSPNVQSSSNSNSSVVVHPPPSPLSEAIKRSKITLTPDDQYLIKANSGNFLREQSMVEYDPDLSRNHKMLQKP